MDELDLRGAAENIAKAIHEEGRDPAYHRRIMRSHRREWPTLWDAIDDLLLVLEKEGT